MKSKMFFMVSLAIILVGEMVCAQDYFRDRTNVVLFGGYNADQQNTNNNGNYEGVYADWLAYKSAWSGWSAGPYLSADQSAFTLNMLQYNSKTKELGGGGEVGYYSPNFSSNNQMFTGVSLGLKYNAEDGESLIRHGPSKGHYVGKQQDVMLTSAINFNLLKSEWALRPNLFTRLQIIAMGQFPISSTKKSYWNDSLQTAQPWDKTYGQVMIKENIVKLRLSDKVFGSPKVIGYYAYSRGDSQRNAYGFGLEIAVFKLYKEDFAYINGIYEIKPAGQSNVFLWGINFNLSSLLPQ